MISILKKIFGIGSQPRQSSYEKVAISSTENKSEPSGFYRAITGTFDTSYFINGETGKFQFPKYKTSDSLVRIKDTTNYCEDFWYDYSKNEKENYTIRDFERDFVSVDLEIEPFWAIFKRMSIEQLSPFQFLKNKADELESIIYEIEEEVKNDTDYILPDFGLRRELLERDCFEELSIENTEEYERYKNKLLNSLSIPELKEFSKRNNLRTSLKKQDLINQLKSLNTNINIPKPIRPNANFYKMIEKFINVYINDIKKAIDNWHPLYFEEVWYLVSTESEFDNCDIKAKEVYDSKYWEDRLFFENY